MSIAKKVAVVCDTCGCFATDPDKCRKGCTFYMGKPYAQCPICKHYSLEEVNVGDDRQTITIAQVCELCGYQAPQGRLL